MGLREPATRLRKGSDWGVSRRRLFQRIGAAGQVITVSAPAGSGKTFLLRSWTDAAGLADRVAWVSVPGGERDPQRFWIMVANALRDAAGPGLVRSLTAGADLDGWASVERLLEDLKHLEDRIWLVIDDLHELSCEDGLCQLETLIMQAPSRLRFVLATRHELRLKLHQLRLEGELTEIRAVDLQFTLDETRELFESAEVRLADTALALLHGRAEGWAAGLRLATLSLAQHPDPDRFAEEFSGSERTVAEYLRAEVLEHQSADARRLLLRTSVLDRVCGELADLLAGDHAGERTLHDLEQANAFVMPLDACRSWFRYHHLFADLLQLELRATARAEVPGLHRIAAEWFAAHGYLAEAVRHAQAAEDWGLAVRLLSDHWVDLAVSGQSASARKLLARFPEDMAAADAELSALMAVTEITHGSVDAAQRHLARAARRVASVAVDRRGRLQMRLEDAESLLEHAERVLGADAESAAGVVLHQTRGMIELARNRDADALVTFRTADKLAGLSADTHPMRARTLQVLVRLGETERVAAALDEMDGQQHDDGEMRIVQAELQLANGDPRAAAAALAPILAGSAAVTHVGWATQAFLLDAIARDALGDQIAAGRALEKALDLADPNGLILAFLLSPAPELLQRHVLEGTAHDVLASRILGILTGMPAAGADRPAAPGEARGLRELLTQAESRVLCYLPTPLSTLEIADQLFLSVNTVRTHVRHIYDKLDAHHRHEAVDRARALGLLAPPRRIATARSSA
jgi:ATP/maltotriose-dependent transcriptional regulator MalT